MNDDPMAKTLANDLDTGFPQLYDQYRRLVFSVTLRLSGRRDDAEDLAAEAFLRAYRALLKYDADQISRLRTRAWLMTIVVNLWRNRLRRLARKPSPGTIDDVDEPLDLAESVEDAVERHATGDRLALALSKLPRSQREAVVLRHVVDVPVAEIATILDIPQGTVKSHVSRGLRRLRADLETEGDR